MLALVVGIGAMPQAAQANGLPLPLLAKKKKKKKKKKGLTPEQAANRRMPIQDQGRQMVTAGELTAATILFDSAADTHGDPVLFLDAGDAYLQIAIDERDLASAETAKLRAWTSEDILYFHLDSSSDRDYRLVTDSEITGLLARAGQLIDKADATIAEIEDEQENVATPGAAPKPKGDGKIMRTAGVGLIGLGVAGAGVGVAGLVIGRINQSKVNESSVYGTEFDGYDTKGRRGNVIAGVGFAVGGVAIIAGATLFIIGRRRGKNAGNLPLEQPDDTDETSEEDLSLAIVPTRRGIALVGRF